jgi:hypothetical protein
MTRGGRSREGGDELPALIREQLRDPANRQRLSRMPDFRVDTGPSEIFSDLLRRLDRAEQSSGYPRRG